MSAPTRKRRQQATAVSVVWLLASTTTGAFHVPGHFLPSRHNVQQQRAVTTAAAPIRQKGGSFLPAPHRLSSSRSAMKMMVLRNPLSSTDAFVPPPPEQVLRAVEKGRGRVTAQDVSALAGVDLRTAQKGLVALATLVQGDLEVSKEGELVYNFPANFRTALRTRSSLQRAKEIWAKIWPPLFYTVRVSFGLALVASIVIIFTTIAVGGSASVGGDDDDRRGGRRSSSSSSSSMGGPRFVMSSNPFDFFFYRPYGYYYTDNPRIVGGGAKSGPPEMGFFESCFSYIFGDGDPNAGFDEERFQIIAQVIRKNGGAVVAEQLAPYLDAPPPEDPNAYSFSGSNALSGVVDESYVLPVLTGLNGRPEVTPDGSIIYLFPDLMTSAVDSRMDVRATRTLAIDRDIANRYSSLNTYELRELLRSERVPCNDCYDKTDLLNRLRDYLLSTPLPSFNNNNNNNNGDIPPLVQEQEVPFSLAPVQNRVFAGILGAVNLGGAVYLGNLLRTYASLGALPAPFALAATCYTPLLTYAIGFNLIPALRSLWNKEKNREIRERNESRKMWSNVLGRAVGPLYNKILSARSYRSKLKVLRDDDITFTTAKSATEQLERDSLQEFDAKVDLNEKVYKHRD